MRTLVFDTPGRDGTPPGPISAPGRRTSRAVRPLLATAAVLAVLMVGFALFSGFWTDLLWYRAVRYPSVFGTLAWTRIGLFAVFGATMAAAVGANLYLAYRLRPPLSAMSAEQHSLDRYRTAIAPHRAGVLAGVCALSGVAAGAAAAGRWRQWLQFAHATSFHTRDPQFHKDVSFYTFDLPWYRFLLGFGFAVALVSLAAALFGHYLYGGLRATSPGGSKATGAATGHLAVLLGLFTGLKAVAYWLDRYGLVVRSGGARAAGAAGAAGNWTGLRYVDANAYLPAKTILFFVALICSALFFATAWRRTWTLPAVGFGLLVFSAILIGGLYPAIVQKFQVQPNEAAKEAPYLQHNIDATRAAFGLDGTVETPYKGSSGEPAATVRADASSAASIRVLDPSVVAPTFQQTQASRGYYAFPSALDVDRYTVDGVEQDVVVGARELDTKGIPDRDWINEHFRYTHGYGLVAAEDTEVTGERAAGPGTQGTAAAEDGEDSAGRPVYTERDLPAKGDLGDYRQQIYYGEQTTQWSVVDGPTKELDYADGTGETTTSYSGPGVSLDNPVTRAAYAITLGEPRILYSGAIGHGSKILYDRTPTQRVEAVAPWLTTDGDPYPAVVGDRLVWIVDAYTTTDDYPYSSRATLGGGGSQVNYVRNSVKATVDAYDGTVKLYQWDTHDPVLTTWMRAFPHTVLPRSAIPAALTAHLRYPQDLFTTQRKVLTRYHVTTAQQLSSGSEAWQAARGTAAGSGKAAALAYMSLRLPGQTARTFSLTSEFTPARSGSLAAFLSVDSDAASPGYGRLRLLELPAGASVDGPQQVQSSLESTYAQVLSRMRGKESTVEYGNLLTLPVDGGVLYVEPVYVKAAGGDYPLLGKVFAAYGKSTAFEDTLEQALDAVFTEEPAATADQAASASPTGGTTAGDPAVRAALQRAQQAYDQVQEAMAKGDWAAYGAAQRRLGAALKQAEEAEKADGAGGTVKADKPDTADTAGRAGRAGTASGAGTSGASGTSGTSGAPGSRPAASAGRSAGKPARQVAAS
ncbi:UPF0182 family membrane protein [Actinacidiphila yeochonensis]|uniref:UPF0182 family membrane protein n=1 Tax=Actinacidiphila yeochonensis TaxID=89050 RepID=UPI00099C0ED6|nr:UPF0182 family protein [Actinacidiphila yeochonensis]